MAEYLIQGETLFGIAEAIRGKTGSTEAIAVSAMAEQIASITGGGTTEKDVFAAQTVTGFTYAEAYGAYINTAAPAPFVLEDGKEYVVVWDTETYKRTAFSFAAADGASCVGVGNQLAAGGQDSEEPFCIVCDTTNNYVHFFALDDKTEHEVRIYRIVSGGSSDDVRYVTFMSSDGTVEYGKKAVAVGDDCADPIARGVFDTPTKESTAQYSYTFAGWATTVNGALDSNALKAVEEDRTVYANYISTVRVYTITYYDSDGTTVLKTESLAYGTVPSYKPTKDGCTFNSWEPAVSAVTGDVSYYAKWDEIVTFADGTWADIARISESGRAAEFFEIGDTKEIELTDGTNVTLEIIAFAHDNLSDGTGKAGITCWTKNAITGYTHMNTSATNKTNWSESNMRKRLSSGGTVYTKIPEELRNVVKSVTKVSSTYDLNTESTDDQFWLLSTTEIGLPSSSYYTAGQGTRYSSKFDYATSPSGMTDADLYKPSVGTNYGSYCAMWWLRTAYKDSSNNKFCRVGADTNDKSKSGVVGLIAYNANIGSVVPALVFGFCI